MNKKDQEIVESKKVTRVIIFNLAFIIFGLAGLASGTMAWFLTSTSYDAEVGSFSVVAPEGVEYSLFYLDFFTPDPLEPATTKDGNYDNVISCYAGYETSYENATFAKIEYDSGGNVTSDPNPTDITNLWPNHRLTFAVITSSSVSKLQLSEWSESLADTTGHAKVAEGTDPESYVYLSWAIDIYGRAFSVEQSGNSDSADLADLSTGYALYRETIIEQGRDDRFVYSEDSPAPDEHPELTIIGHDDPIEYETISDGNPIEATAYNTVPLNSSGSRSILFFTIEFSNDSSTFYSETAISDEDIYYAKDPDGNSNCYEKLKLTRLLFKLS